MTVTDRQPSAAFTDLAARHGVPLTAIGRTGGDALVVEGQFAVPLDELRAAWTATLPAALRVSACAGGRCSAGWARSVCSPPVARTSR